MRKIWERQGWLRELRERSQRGRIPESSKCYARPGCDLKIYDIHGFRSASVFNCPYRTCDTRHHSSFQFQEVQKSIFYQRKVYYRDQAGNQKKVAVETFADPLRPASCYHLPGYGIRTA